MSKTTVQDSVNVIVDEINALDADDVILVGHKLAGLAMPRVMAAVPHKIRHVVFVAAYILPKGVTVLESVPPGLAKGASNGPIRMSREMTIEWECYNMTPEQTEFTCAITCAEAPNVVREGMVLTGLEQPIPRTWVRLLSDRSSALELQAHMIPRARCTEVIDLDSGHLVMVRHPKELAAILNEIRARYAS
jgi:hypothetical protein